MWRQPLYDYAMRMTGLPYIWGGDDPIRGFDCSGFVLELLRAVGQVPQRQDMTAQQLWDKFKGAETSISRFGALLFFGASRSSISHVGFAMCQDLMLEAGGGGRDTTSSDTAARQNAYVRLRPIAGRKDLVAIAMPDYGWLDI